MCMRARASICAWLCVLAQGTYNLPVYSYSMIYYTAQKPQIQIQYITRHTAVQQKQHTSPNQVEPRGEG